MVEEIQISVVMGMLGMSIEDISEGKKGFAMLPLGVRDATMAGGRKWVKIEVTALENVRANRDIIVANEQGDIKEHTPVELSYEKSAGGYQRVGADHPLPVTMGSKGITWKSLTKTATGAEELVAGVSGKKIRIHYLIISNNQAAIADVGISFVSTPTVDADFEIQLFVPADGGTVPLNLTDANVEGAEGETLYAYCAAAYASGVYFTVGYELI